MAVTRSPDKPVEPPTSGGEDERIPNESDPIEPGEDVKEPPPPGRDGTVLEFPRVGEVT
jgi:hypothetical protein